MGLASSIAKGGVVNLTHLDMGAHTGTHMDAPVHFYRDGSGVDELPLEALFGACRVFDLTGITSTFRWRCWRRAIGRHVEKL